MLALQSQGCTDSSIGFDQSSSILNHRTVNRSILPKEVVCLIPGTQDVGPVHPVPPHCPQAVCWAEVDMANSAVEMNTFMMDWGYQLNLPKENKVESLSTKSLDRRRAEVSRSGYI